MVITSVERARDLDRPVVRLLATAEAHGNGGSWDQWPDLTTMHSVRTAPRLLQRAAGEIAGIEDIDVACIYDCFTFTVMAAVRQVEALDRRIIVRVADVRDQDAVQATFDQGIAELGRADIVLANAGIMPIIGESGARRQAWHDSVDIMLTGVLHTCEAAIPTLIDQGDGGSIVITSSTAGFKGPMRTLGAKNYGLLGYVAAKHGVIGLMRCYANALGPYKIRCNTIHPTGVNTPMVANPEFDAVAAEKPELIDAMHNVLPVDLIEPVDISNAIVYLASDAGRYVTGTTMPVDAGQLVY